MKKRFLVLLVSCLLISPLNAKPLAQEGGWEFTLSLNAGAVGGRSNLTTSDDNKVISDVNNQADASSRAIAFPFVRVQYTAQDLKTQLFLGNSREQISTSQFQYEFGVTHQFSDTSKLTAAYFPELPLFNETWQDPFLVGQKRVKTDNDAQGGRIQLERIAGGPLTLKYAYARSHVDNDQSGASWLGLTQVQLKSLQRSSDYHRVALETMFPIARGVFLKPTLQYTMRSADGEAESFDDYNFKLALLVFKGRHTSISTVNIGSSVYQQQNPIFDKKQDSTNAGIFSVYSYARPFNWQDVTFSLIAGYNQKQSHISFYDESGFIVSTGLAYTF